MSLSREEMIAVIKGGGSVLVGDGMAKRIVSRTEDLPSAVDAARGDKDKLRAARDALVQRREHIEAEIAAAEVLLATADNRAELAATQTAQAGLANAAPAGSAESGASEQPGAGPAESGSGGRSQGTADVGTAPSDAQGAPEQAPPETVSGATPPADSAARSKK